MMQEQELQGQGPEMAEEEMARWARAWTLVRTAVAVVGGGGEGEAEVARVRARWRGAEGEAEAAVGWRWWGWCGGHRSSLHEDWPHVRMSCILRKQLVLDDCEEHEPEHEPAMEVHA